MNAFDVVLPQIHRDAREHGIHMEVMPFTPNGVFFWIPGNRAAFELVLHGDPCQMRIQFCAGVNRVLDERIAFYRKCGPLAQHRVVELLGHRIKEVYHEH